MSDSLFSYCLNTSTIRSEGVSVMEYIDIAADAGYDGIEPWVEEIDRWVDGGGTVSQLRERAESRGIRICLLYTSPSPRDVEESRMPSSA